MVPWRFPLIYGSQTGQSEAISEQIALQAAEQRVEPILVCDLQVAEGLVAADLMKEQVVVFVVSSTGEGDPPENFERYWSDLQSLEDLSHLSFALLGLGDTNYTEYGGFPNTFHTFLTERGAKSFYQYQLADDAVGLELVVEPWIEGLWEPLLQQLSSSPAEESLAAKLAALSITPTPTNSTVPTKQIYSLDWVTDGKWDRSFPYGVDKLLLPFSDSSPLHPSTVLSVSALTSDDRVKETFELEISTGTPYGPGNSFGVLCENSDSEVTALLARLSLDPHHLYRLTVAEGVKPRLLPKHVLLECTPWYALKYTADIHSLPKKALLKFLAECCEDRREGDVLRYLASKEGSADLNELVYSRGLSLLELLTLFPSCVPGLGGLLQFLPRLTPRYYSVSRVTQQGVKFVFNVITNTRHPSTPPLPGVCSSWLSSLQPGATLYTYRRKNDSFTPAPGGRMILIGAGTGVAPFLGFLDAANPTDHVTNPSDHVTTPSDHVNTPTDHVTTPSGHVTTPTDHVTLITGNRYRELDSLYETEFSEHLRAGKLSTWHRAFSRDDERKAGERWRYVQDVIRGTAAGPELIRGITEQGAAVYVCGDAKGLAAGVWEALIEGMERHTGRSREESERYLKEMRTTKRYCEDIWS